MKYPECPRRPLEKHTDHVMSLRTFLGIIIACWSVIASGQQPSSWMEPFPPHKIAGNLYYVGSKDLASYLIATPEGHILINSSFEESVPLIRASIEKLGFKFADVKILLISHAHSDHCAGSAEIIKQTKAQYFVMEEDADAVESGGAKKSRLGRPSYTQFPPAKVDRRLKDGDEVKLGGSTLVAHLTPGHTRGCTTWTMKVRWRKPQRRHHRQPECESRLHPREQQGLPRPSPPTTSAPSAF